MVVGQSQALMKNVAIIVLVYSSNYLVISTAFSRDCNYCKCAIFGLWCQKSPHSKFEKTDLCETWMDSCQKYNMNSYQFYQANNNNAVNREISQIESDCSCMACLIDQCPPPQI